MAGDSTRRRAQVSDAQATQWGCSKAWTREGEFVFPLIAAAVLIVMPDRLQHMRRLGRAGRTRAPGSHRKTLEIDTEQRSRGRRQQVVDAAQYIEVGRDAHRDAHYRQFP